MAGNRYPKSSTAAVAKRGRPRSEAARAAVLAAAADLLTEGGLGAFTIEAVADASGVAKTTIYRWWASRGLLATECFLLAMAPRMAYPAHASAIASIEAQLHLVAKVFSGRAGITMCALLAEAQLDKRTHKAFLEHYFKPRRAEAARVIRLGIDSGELRRDIDVEATIDSLYGPVYYRLLVKHQPVTRSFVNEVLRNALHGINRLDAPSIRGCQEQSNGRRLPAAHPAEPRAEVG